MASERETVADICKMARKELDKSWWEIDREFVRDLPMKILEAHKREMADALDTGVNMAKMREALESISSILKGFDFDNQNAPTPDDLNCVHNAISIADAALAALAAPARKCDKMPW